MRIAVTSQNFRAITPHAGATRRFLVYEAEPGKTPREVDRLDLPRGMAMHEFHGPGPHPLDGVDAILTGGAGNGFVRRMAARNIEAVVTAETDPLTAVKRFVAGTLDRLDPKEHGTHVDRSACIGAAARTLRRHKRRGPAAGCEGRSVQDGEEENCMGGEVKAAKPRRSP